MDTRRGNNYLRRSTRFANRRRSLWGAKCGADIEISSAVTPKDLEELLASCAAEEKQDFFSEGEERVRTASRAVVLRKSKLAIALFGWTLIDDGIAHAWAVITDKTNGLGLPIIRLVLQLMEEAQDKHGPLRFFTWSLAGQHENSRWLNMLDFQRYVTIDFEDDSNSWEGYLR